MATGLSLEATQQGDALPALTVHGEDGEVRWYQTDRGFTVDVADADWPSQAILIEEPTAVLEDNHVYLEPSDLRRA